MDPSIYGSSCPQRPPGPDEGPDFVDVVWSAVLSIDSDAFMARREASSMPTWAKAQSNSLSVAAEVFRDWISSSDRRVSIPRWEDWYGADVAFGSAIVIIHEPAEISGRYDVAVERVVSAEARQLTDKESALLDMMIAGDEA